MNCAVESCKLKYAAKGYCHLHYNRWKRHGNPLVANRMAPRGTSAAERLPLLRDESGGPDACWPGTRTPTSTGYIRVQIDRVTKGLHVWALIVATGEDRSAELDALHSCDNPPCANPAHLRWGTLEDNMADKVARGRQSRTAGESHPGAKLTWTDVRAIRARRDESLSVLALEFGVSRSLVSLILRNERWIEAAA